MPTPAEPDLSVVMPVFNEEEALPEVLDEAVAALKDVPFTSEILLVDDGSRDRSALILTAYQARFPDRIRVLSHGRNRGLMAAFETLYKHARGKFVFINGSDGQIRTAEAVKMMALRERYDIVVGRRQHKQYTLRRHIVSGAFNFMPVLLFGVRLHDAGNVKLFRREVLSIPLVSKSPFREGERLIRAKKCGYRIGCVPVEHHPRHGGKATGARWSLVKQAVVDMIRCWWEIMVRGNTNRI